MKRILILLAVVFVMGCAAYEPTEVVITNSIGEEITVYAETPPPEQFDEGLMGRTTLDKYEGMLFVFEEGGMHGFWMKNMKISIDIIFISADGRIVDIKENLRPCISETRCPVYAPEKPAKYVLEVRSGFAEENGIEVGNHVEILN